MSKHMGQIMAECGCQHSGCEMRGQCMADHIEELRKEKMELRKWIEKNVGSDSLDLFDTMMSYRQIFQKDKTDE